MLNEKKGKGLRLLPALHPAIAINPETDSATEGMRLGFIWRTHVPLTPSLPRRELLERHIGRSVTAVSKHGSGGAKYGLHHYAPYEPDEYVEWAQQIWDEAVPGQSRGPLNSAVHGRDGFSGLPFRILAGAGLERHQSLYDRLAPVRGKLKRYRLA